MKAFEEIWLGNWAKGSETADKVANALSGEELRPYRALWKYIASYCSSRAGEGGRKEFADLARKQLEDCADAARKTSFFRQVVGEPGDQLAMDLREADPVTLELAGMASRGAHLLVMPDKRFEREAAGLLELLGSTDSGPYEEGLRKLGRMLGFDARRPGMTAAPDSIWIASSWWIVFEAKSEAEPTGEIGANTVRQVGLHMQWVKSELGGGPPPGSITVLATPKKAVEREARKLLLPDLYRVDPGAIVEIATDTIAAWRQIRVVGRASSEETVRRLILDHFEKNSLTAPQLRRRLTAEPLKKDGSDTN